MNNIKLSNFQYARIIICTLWVLISGSVGISQDTISSMQSIEEILVTARLKPSKSVFSMESDTLSLAQQMLPTIRNVLQSQADMLAFNQENFAQDIRISIRGKTIPVIQELYSQGVRVFMLQEAPALIHLHGDNPTLAEECHYAIADEFYTRLQVALPQLEIKDAPYSKNWGRTDSAGLLTIVDKQWSDKLIDTTMDMKSHVSENNQERFQSFDLYLNGITDPIKIANFHADFFTQEDTKADVKYFVSDHYVVGGDFNLIELPELGVNVVSDKTEPGLMLTDTYDAIFCGDPDAQYVSPLLDAFIGITEVLIEDAHWVFNDIIIDTQMMSAPIQHGYLDHFDQAAILV